MDNNHYIITLVDDNSVTTPISCEILPQDHDHPPESDPRTRLGDDLSAHHPQLDPSQNGLAVGTVDVAAALRLAPLFPLLPQEPRCFFGWGPIFKPERFAGRLGLAWNICELGLEL